MIRPAVELAMRFVRGRERTAITVALAFLVMQVSLGCTPILFGVMLDLGGGAAPDREARLAGCLGGILALALVHVAANRIFTPALAELAYGTAHDLRLRLADALLRLSFAFHQRTGIGVLHTRIVAQVGDVVDLPGYYLGVFGSGLVIMAVAIAYLAFAAPLLLPFVAALVVLAAALVGAFRRPLALRTHRHRRALERMGQHLADLVRMLPLTRAQAAEESWRGSARRAVGAEYERARDVAVLQGWMSSSGILLFHAFQALSLGAAAWMAFSGWISAGTVAVFALYYLQIGHALYGIAEGSAEVIRDAEAFRAIDEILEADEIDPYPAGPRPLPGGDAGFELRDVSFTYPGAGRPALDRVSLRVAPGVSLGVAGPGGSGKTTLIHAILGFVRPGSGTILFGDAPYGEFDLAALRRRIAVVFPEPLLFAGSLRENLCIGLGEVPPGRIAESLERACLREVVARLPGGLDHRLGEGGAGLSAGERQRVAIARALLRDPRVLIMDEPTSALDAESQAHVHEAMRELMRGRTCLVAGHALPILDACDRVIVLEEGRIVADGPPAVVAGGDNHYARSRARSRA